MSTVSTVSSMTVGTKKERERERNWRSNEKHNHAQSDDRSPKDAKQQSKSRTLTTPATEFQGQHPVVSHKETAIEIVGISDVFHVDCTILHQGYQGPRQCDRHFPHQSIDSDRKSQGTSPARGVGHFEKEQLASCWIWRRMN